MRRARSTKSLPVPECPCHGTAPIVSVLTATRLANRLARGSRLEATAALHAAIDWLRERSPGLESYEAIQGRPYGDYEKVHLAPEVLTVMGLPCPFRTPSGECLIGGLSEYPDTTGAQPYGFLPALLTRCYAPETLKQMARRGIVADAKLALLTTNDTALLALHGAART